MFTLTEDWLHRYYGSIYEGQVELTKRWLEQYGTNVTPEQVEEWKKWKHLSEYQPNCPDIVPICLSWINHEFYSELQAHKAINLLRVPLAKAYIFALDEVNPKTILELGVGGDSAISTSVFLSWVEENQGMLYSVDHNPLGLTAKRYEKYKNVLWKFDQMDSTDYLIGCKGPFDMIFIDTSHSYRPTMLELSLASKLTNNILMDDALFEGNSDDLEKGGVKRAIEDWTGANDDWTKTEYWHGNVVLLRKEN